MVGLLALGGFIVGIVWPRLAGLSLVPEAPVDEISSPAAAEPPEAPLEAAPSGHEPATKKLSPEDTLAIGEADITSCRDAKGKSPARCGELDVDALVHAELRSLAQCPGATGAFGTLSIGFELDFEDKKKIVDVKSGRSTDLPKAPAEELLRCAKKALREVSLATAQHEHARYTVFYKLLFKTPEAALGEKSEISSMSGQALVQWQTALVRENPERDATVKARVLTGTRLLVTGRKGEWYRVKYDAKGREGWVHGAALGLGK